VDFKPSAEMPLQPHTWKFTLVLVEMPNRKTASFEQKNRPGQETTMNYTITGELHMPAKRIATEIQRKEQDPLPPHRPTLMAHAGGVAKLKPRNAPKHAPPTWMRARVDRRPYQAPTMTSKHGCQSPLFTLLRRTAREKYKKIVSRTTPAKRLVCVELNPGPPKRGAKQAAIAKRKSQPKKRQQRKQPVVARPRVPKGGTTKSANRIKRSLTISEDEYIADVVLTSAGFTNLQYAINPGNSVTFPWLSTIAANFNKYKFTKLKFYYQRIASEFATPGQTGDIVLSVNPDASDPAPVAQAQVYDLQMRDAAMPCENFVLNKISLAELNKQDSFYVRVGAAPANTDIKTYDCGNLNVSTIGTASSGICGKLFVSYSVMLHSPVLVQPATGGVVHFSSIAATTANNFAAAALQAGGTPAMAGIVLGTNTVVFPAGIPGNYLLNLMVAGGTSASALSATGILGLNVFTQSGVRDAVGSVSSLAGTTTAVASLSYAAVVSSAGGTITVSPSTIVGTGSMDLFITALPAAVLTVDEHEQQEIDELRARADVQDDKIARLMALLEPRVLSVAQQTLSDDDDYSGSSSSAAPSANLSDSTLGLIGAIIARKSSSRK
jgi:hypothetical protein